MNIDTTKHFADQDKKEFCHEMKQRFGLPHGSWIKIFLYYEQISDKQKKEAFIFYICKYVEQHKRTPPNEEIEQQIIPKCAKPLPQDHSNASNKPAKYVYTNIASTQVTQPKQISNSGNETTDIEASLHSIGIENNDIVEGIQYTDTTRTSQDLHTSYHKTHNSNDIEIAVEEAISAVTTQQEITNALMQSEENSIGIKRSWLQSMFDVGLPYEIPITKIEFWISIFTTYAIQEWTVNGLDVYGPAACSIADKLIRIFVAGGLLFVHSVFAIWNIDIMNNNGYYSWKQAIGHICFLLWEMLAASSKPWSCFGIDEYKYEKLMFWGFPTMIMIGILAAIYKRCNQS